MAEIIEKAKLIILVLDKDGKEYKAGLGGDIQRLIVDALRRYNA